MKINKLALMISSILGASICSFGIAAEKNTPNEGFLDEIVVTAQKRSESVQDVAMAISAFDGRALADSGVENSQDLEMVTPGLNLASTGTLGSVYIRGVGTALQGVSTDTSTAIYIDGAYISRFTSSLVDLLDVERVEVLKGPQVVLYGRNATAGAIHVVSKTPGEEFGGNVAVQLGNYDLFKFTGAVDIPLIEDKLLLRAALMHVTDEGYTKNTFLPNDRIDRQDTLKGRFTLLYKGSDDFDLTLRASFDDENGSRSALKALDPGSLGGSPIADLRTVSSDQFTHMPIENQRFSAEARWDLGWAELKSITAYADDEFGPLNYDADTIETTIFNVGVIGQPDIGLYQSMETLSEEITLVGSTDKVDWLAGVFFLKEEGEFGGADEFGPGVAVFFPAESTTDAYSAYGSVAYQLTENLKINAGLRYSYEEKEAGRTAASTSPAPLQYDTASWDSWTPSIGMQYSLSDDGMLYATVSRGFKSGGFNQFDTGPALEPEFVTSYEVGFKTRLMNERVQVNVAAFEYDYTDLQVQRTLVGGVFIWENAADADIKGFEIDVKAALFDGFRLDLGVAYTDAEFADFETIVGGIPVNLAGKKLQNAPELTVNVGASYTAAYSDSGNVTARVDFYRSDEKFFTNENDSALKQDGYHLVNSRVSFEPNDESWRFSLYGRNLTDEDVFASAFSLGTPIVTLLAPRTFGVELEKTF